MLMMKERLPPFRTVEGWARLILLEAGAIRECEEDGWMRDRSDPPCPRASLPRCQAISAVRRHTRQSQPSKPCSARPIPARNARPSPPSKGRSLSRRHD
jgi:hypothetical protein